MSSPIAAGRPYSPEETQRIIEQFNRDGYCHLGPVLAADEVEALREAMAHKVADPRILERRSRRSHPRHQPHAHV